MAKEGGGAMVASKGARVHKKHGCIEWGYTMDIKGQ